MDEREMMDSMRPGHFGCQGCGEAMGMRLVLRAIGPKAVVAAVPFCGAVIAGAGVYPHTSFKVPIMLAAFETAAPTAAAIASVFAIQGHDDIPVLAFAGDGGTFDIGLQSLSGAAARNDNIIYVCFDNEAYMNTGIQVSSATPRFTWTGTTPSGNPRPKKHIMEIMAAHRIPYAATASIGFPEDLMKKVERAKGMRGTRFIHLFSPCPTGWKMEDHMGPKAAVAAVETNIFPLYEIVNGLEYTINHHSKSLPVGAYLSLQGRYKHLTAEEVCYMQAETDRAWSELKRKATAREEEQRNDCR